MTQATRFSGGCACGAIRYESTAEPLLMLHCHCRDCQRASGGPFSSFFVLPKDAFHIVHGALHVYDSPSHPGGKTHRSFCPDCGSPLTAESPASGRPIVAVYAASLDDPSWFRPQMNVWTCDAYSWDEMNPALPQFEMYPE